MALVLQEERKCKRNRNILKTEPKFKGRDLSGLKFGRLTVRFLDGFYRTTCLGRPQRQPIWRCQCDCGKESKVVGGQLRSGNTKSCGCLHNELLARQSRTHGFKPKNGIPHPFYFRWYGMIQRCGHKNHSSYKNYGARGIKVCKRWRRFDLWLQDMGNSFERGLTIERRNNLKNYSPSNCRWATRKEQANNSRSNTILTLNGESMNVAQWSERTGIPRTRLYMRLKAGWSVKKTLGTP